MRVIVKTFNIIVEANIIVESQRYIYFDKFHEMILNIKKIYQNIIRCDINTIFSTISNIFEKNFLDDNNKKNFLNNIFELDEKNFFNNEFEKNNSIIDVLVVATIFDFDNNIDFLFLLSRFQFVVLKKRKNRKSKVNKFENFFRLLNVYIDLYLANNAREYEIIININVLASEIKHMSIFFQMYLTCC